MRVFNFQPADHRDAYQRDGWVHIPNGVTPEFHSVLREFAATSLGVSRVEGAAIGGKDRKDQALFEFPGEVDFPGEVFDVVASLCGLNRPTMTLSERHINAYFEGAPPEPTAHKDRYASQVSVGLSIDIPAESRVVLYPYDHRQLNPFNVSGALLESLPAEEHPDVALRTAREVEIDDSPGDVLAFPGSTVWHLRRRSAGAVILYLKMNDFGCDPLGEDPTTESRRSATLAALEAEGDLDGLVPVLSRRLDTITRRYVRDDWGELLRAHFWDRPPVALGDAELELLKALDGRRTIGELATEHGGAGDGAGARQQLRELAERQVVDLLSEPVPG